MNVEKKVTEMFLEMHNNPVDHKNVREVFPSECFPQICMTVSKLTELVNNRHIHCELKLRDGTCSVSFVYFASPSCDEQTPFEKKVRAKFNGDEDL